MPVRLNGSTSGYVDIAAPAVAGTTTVTLPSSSSTLLSSVGDQTTTGTFVMSSPYTMRNKIINGAMVIDQRNAGASVTPANGAYTLDRWQANLSQSSKFSVQQVSDGPSGFQKSLKVTSLSAYTVLSSDFFTVEQVIEGFNTADLAYGSSGALTTTLSFWVKSSLTGTFGGALYNNGASSYANTFSYTINAANTWEQKTVTITGPTGSTWNTTNGGSINVCFSVGMGTTYQTAAGSWGSTTGRSVSGAVNVVSTNAATWQVTGVQLERGTVATPFEYRNYQQELAMCQRYFQIAGSGGCGSFDNSTTTIQMTEKLAIPMRTQPTGSIRSGVTASFRSVGGDFTAASPALANFTTNPSAIGDGIAFWTQVTGFTGGTSNAVANSRNNQVTNGGAFINLSAEL